MATTTNYGWTTPDDTALVKDGAAAIRTLGSSVDTTTKALNPSTTLGDIEYRSSTANTNTRLGIGTSGQVLAVSGGGVPAWTTVSSGGMTLLNTGGTTLSGSTITLDNIPGTYRNLQLIVVNPNPANDADYLRVRINGDSNTRYKEFQDGVTEDISFDGSSMFLTAAVDNGTSDGMVVANFYDYANTVSWKLTNYASASNYYGNTSKIAARAANVIYNQTGAITSLVISFFGGNMDSGTAYLYGVK